MFSEVADVSIQELGSDLLRLKKVQVFVQREDLIHPFISGNKYRKLKYNMIYAKKEKFHKILTFGGAYSNHILAVAACSAHYGLQSIGVIRGEENLPLNYTLNKAKSFGMKFLYIDRKLYKLKRSKDWLKEYKNCYIIPEGGNNELGIKGCEEIISDEKFDIICCACGTGGTITGIIRSLFSNQQAIGFSVLKGNMTLVDEISENVKSTRWQIKNDYHFGGYAKVSKELINFINEFKRKHKIALDPIYTGKMFYGVIDLISKDYFNPGTKILLIHTGGLQGIVGMNSVINKKGWHID